ncbi:hypothetical protein NBRC116492_19360 [Aurantivibrio infirmus]
MHWTDIEFVELKVENDALTFSTIYEDCIIFSEEYKPGKHFEIKNSKIVIDDDIDLLYEALLGVTTSKQTMELDENGNLIIYSRYSVIGTVLVIPVVGGGIEKIRFLRDMPKEVYEPCVK